MSTLGRGAYVRILAVSAKNRRYCKHHPVVRHTRHFVADGLVRTCYASCFQVITYLFRSKGNHCALSEALPTDVLCSSILVLVTRLEISGYRVTLTSDHGVLRVGRGTAKIAWAADPEGKEERRRPWFPLVTSS